MPYCCVPFCNSRTEKNIRLFSVPQGDRNKERRHQWMKLIKRDILPMSAFVCEFHFTEDQFENNRLDKRRPLKCSAVPTLFPGKKENPDIKVQAEQNDKEGSLSLKKGNLVKCRTCLLDTNKEKCSSMKKLLYGTTIKQMMIRCVPQMSGTIEEHNYICNKCLRCLVKCIKFIDSCLDVEAKIRDGKVIFEPEKNDENTRENEEKKNAINDPNDEKVESISVKNEENCEEKLTTKSKQDTEMEENTTDNEKIDEEKHSHEKKKVKKTNDDISKSEDFQKVDSKQNTLEVKGKRRRKKREIENSAAEEEIEAYLAGEADTSANEEEQVKTITRRQSRREKIGKTTEIRETSEVMVKESEADQDSDIIEILETSLFEEPIEATTRRKRRLVDREKSPKMEIIEKTLGMVVRTYQRKKLIVNNDENKELKTSPQLEHIKQIGEHNESPARINLRTYERKRSSTTADINEIPKKDYVNVQDISPKCERGQMDCDPSPINEHTLRRTDTDFFCERNMNNITDDSVNDISVDHDYIVPAENENTYLKNITLLDENGDFISVDAHVTSEDIGGQELPEQENPNEDEIELKCPSCQIHYKTKRGLRDHLKSCHNIREGDNIYRCRICDEEFVNSKDMFEHKNFHGRPCNLCAEIFPSEEDLNSHKDNHPQSYSCTECGDEFDTDTILEQHKTMHEMMHEIRVESIKKKPKLPPKRFQCESCPLVFRYPTRLRMHRNLVHLKVKAIKCNDCGKMFGSNSTLKQHHRVRHQDQKPFVCDVCGDSFKRNDYLKKHSLVHDHEQQQFISSALDGISIAKKDPSEFKNLKKNPYTYAITRKYTCNVCGLKFSLQRTKFVHERSHNVDPDKKFVCSICWKRISTKEELDEHSKRHERISKKYRCLLCPMKFTRNILLENHILEVHTSGNSQQQKVEIA